MKTKAGDFFKVNSHSTIIFGDGIGLYLSKNKPIDYTAYDIDAPKELWIKLGWIDLNA